MTRSLVPLLLLAGLGFADDPLPKGALARLGTERMRNFDSYGGTRLHPDGKRLIANVRGQLTLIDPTTGDTLGAFGKGTRPIASLSADGARAVSSNFDGFAVWEVETGKVVFEEKRPVGYDDTLVLTPDGKHVGVGGRVNEKMKDKGVVVTVYDVDAGKEVARLKVAQNTSARIALSGDGKRAVTWGYHQEQPKRGEEVDEDASPNKLLQFWDVTKEAELGSGRLSAGYGVSSVTISAAGDRVAASTGDGSVALFDPATGKKVKELLGPARVGGNLTFSPDGKTLAATASAGHVQLWEVDTGKSLGFAPTPGVGDYLTVNSLVFTGPGTAVAFAYVGSTSVVWEVPSGKVLSPLGGHKHGVTGVTFAANDKEVISTGYYGETLRWDTSGKPLGDVKLTTPGSYGSVSTARVLVPAGGTLAVRADSGSGTGVYDLPGGGQRFNLPTPFGGEPPVGVSGDGKTLVLAVPGAYAGANKPPKPGKLVVIDVPNNTKTTEITLPPGTPTAVAVTADGSKAGVFRTVQGEKGGDSKAAFCGVDLKTGKVLGQSEEKGYNVQYAAATPDGKGVLSVKPGNSGGLAVYDLATGEKGAEVKGYRDYISAGPVFSKDGKKVAVVGSPSGTPTITVFDWEAGTVLHEFKGHIKGVSSLAFSADGKRLATGSYDTTVLIWDVSKE